jgi:hypothetical protein
MTPSGIRGVPNDAVSIYFGDVTLASAFVARWCAGYRAETAGDVFQMRGDQPTSRGSVRRTGGRVRITDALSGTHLWAAQLRRFAGRYLRPQDKVVVSVVGVIQPTLQAAEIRRSGERPASDLAAYDLYLRALRILLLWQRGDILTARDLLGQAIDVIRVTGARLGTL